MSPLTLEQLAAINRAVDAMRAHNLARQTNASRQIIHGRYRRAITANDYAEALGVGNLVPDEDEIRAAS